MRELHELGFVKRAAEYGIPAVRAKELFKTAYDDFLKHNLQQYMSVLPKRQLNSDEEEDIAKAKKKLFPKIFKSNKDPIHADMSNPWVPAAGIGALGAGVGGVSGALGAGTAGWLAGEDVSNPENLTQELGGGLGALLGAGIGGLVGYKGREAKNNTLEDMMQRNPPGATRRDMAADPVFQKERDRELQERIARLQAMSAYGNPYNR